MLEQLKIAAILLAALTNLLVGLIVFRKNPKIIVNRYVAILAWAFSLWSICLFFYDYPIILSSLVWIKATYMVVIFGMVHMMYLLSFVFPDGRAKAPLWGWIIYLVIASGFGYLIMFTDLFIKEVTKTAFGPHTSLGPAYIPFNIYATVFSCWGIGFLIKGYRVAKGLVKAQLKYMFLGLSLFVITVVILDFIIPIVTGNSRLFSISTTTSLFYVFCTSYAIIRHRLFDIKLAIGRFVIYTLTSSMVFIVLLSGAILFWFRTEGHIRYNVIPLILSLSFIIGIIYERLLHLARIVAKKFFFQSVYDYQITLLDLTLRLSNYLELPKLTKVIAEALESSMKVNKVAILVREFPSNYYQVFENKGFESDKVMELVYSIPILAYLEHYSTIIILEEISSLIAESRSDLEKKILESIYKVMVDINAVILVPIVHEGVMVGVIAMGDKISRDAFSVQDINLMKTVRIQASIAFENARLYRQVTKLNEGLVEDIKAATANLQEANQRLQSLDKLKDDFVSIASHELRTPMTAIRSYVWMALNKPDIPLSDKLKKYLVRTLVSTERLINLVNDMLNISRIESGKIEILPASFKITDLANEVISEVNPKATEKGLIIEVEESQLPLTFADPDKVHQVLLNLVGNAMKFTPNGGRVTISFFTDGRVVEVLVKDTGVGIAREDLPKLFKKFARLDNSYVAAAVGGTGLGLYISKSLVELMGGRIWVSSEGLNKGSTFVFSLPAAIPQVLANAGKYTNKVTGEPKLLEQVSI